MQIKPSIIENRQLRMKQELLENRRRELEISLSDRRVEMADLDAVTRCVENLRELLEESELIERKAFIQSFVREVKVTGERGIVDLYNAAFA